MPEILNSAPVTIKGVCLDGKRRVLLCRNHRGDWELPGGRPLLAEDFMACLKREVAEETGLLVTVGDLAGAGPFEVLPGRWVNVIVSRCQLTGEATPVPSAEHDRVAFLDPAALTSGELASIYRRVIEAEFAR